MNIGFGYSKEKWLRVSILLGVVGYIFILFLLPKENVIYALGLCFVFLVLIVLFSLFSVYEKMSDYLATKDAPTYRTLAILLERYEETPVMHASFRMTTGGYLEPTNLSFYVNEQNDCIQFSRTRNIRGYETYAVALVINGQTIERKPVSLHHYVNFEKEYPGLTTKVFEKIDILQHLLLEQDHMEQQQKEKEDQQRNTLKERFIKSL